MDAIEAFFAAYSKAVLCLGGAGVVVGIVLFPIAFLIDKMKGRL